MFTEIKNQFVNGIDEQEWMDVETKDQARLKVNLARMPIRYQCCKIPDSVSKGLKRAYNIYLIIK